MAIFFSQIITKREPLKVKNNKKCRRLDANGFRSKEEYQELEKVCHVRHSMVPYDTIRT